MKTTWQLSEADTVTLEEKWNKRLVALNGDPKGKLGRRTLRLTLSDGRTAALTWKRPFVGTAHPVLKVDGMVALMSTPDSITECTNCKAQIRPFDKFCDNCGASLEYVAEAQKAQQQVGGARKTIFWLSVLFAVSGGVMFFVQQMVTADSLRPFAEMSPDTVLDPVDGVVYTVGELREMAALEPYYVLFVNLGLAAVMLGLWVWAKRASFMAIVSATAVFAAVHILNAMLDPATIAQGVIVKVIVAVFLWRGIKSELLLRSRTS